MGFDTKTRAYCFISGNYILLAFCKALEPISSVLIVAPYTTLAGLLRHNSFSWGKCLHVISLLLSGSTITCSHEGEGGAEKETAERSESKAGLSFLSYSLEF